MTTSPVDFRGRPACLCLAEWLPYYERELKARGVIRESVDVFQLIGNAPASAGVHSQGGAYDVAQVQDEAIWVARQMGAAAWARMWTNNIHQHGVLRACPHNGPARYQILALDAGYDGTGSGGRGASDDGPRDGIDFTRTWREGITWHHEQARARKRAVLTGRIVDLVTQRKRLARQIARLREKRAGL